MRPLAALATLLAAGAARGQTAVEVATRTIVPEGAQPSLQVQVLRDLRSLAIDLRGSRGTAVRKKWGRLAAGSVENLSWRHPPGDVERFAGTLSADVPDEEKQSIPVEFEAIVLTGLELRLDKDKVDLARGQLTFTLSRAAGKADLTIRGEKGQVLHEDTVPFDGQPAGTPLIVRWAPPKEPVARIDLRAYDRWDAFSGVALVPWKLEIPHEDVAFRLDSAAIDPPERPKLDASHERIIEAIAAHRDIGEIKLFVAGHTDTQASREYNRKLSGARAAAIAAYFKQKGLPIPIHAYGFGEDALLVATPDETDEPRNRRVDYVIAVEPPRNVGWRRVQ